VLTCVLHLPNAQLLLCALHCAMLPLLCNVNNVLHTAMMTFAPQLSILNGKLCLHALQVRDEYRMDFDQGRGGYGQVRQQQASAISSAEHGSTPVCLMHLARQSQQQASMR